MLTLSKTTTPQKLFSYDCLTLKAELEGQVRVIAVCPEVEESLYMNYKFKFEGGLQECMASCEGDKQCKYFAYNRHMKLCSKSGRRLQPPGYPSWVTGWKKCHKQ